MLRALSRIRLDAWILILLIPQVTMSLFTMNSFTATGGSLAWRQLLWIGIGMLVMIGVSSLKLHFLRQSNIILFFYSFGVGLLILLIFFGSTINGSTSWFSFGAFSFQPADPMKVILILLLSKYLARRHIEIKSLKHIFITAIYLLIPFVLIFLQPDFGSASILLAIWLGMILTSGISKKHLLILGSIAVVLGIGLWFGVLQDYQKDRIVSFINPLSDIRGAGYNAYQATIAVGSGQILGKGVGYGTQSRLHFLPEYQTDFIFASIAEEWGFVGALIVVLSSFGLIVRILYLAFSMEHNLELLFGVGLAIYFGTHMIINIGMNIGLFPVTGVPLPFLSYGGSHIVAEFLSLGILMSFAHQQQGIPKNTGSELVLH